MRYHFETIIGSVADRDANGVELASDDEAVQLALRTLGGMVRDAVVDLEDGSTIAVRVTADDGAVVCEAALNFTRRRR